MPFIRVHGRVVHIKDNSAKPKHPRVMGAKEGAKTLAKTGAVLGAGVASLNIGAAAAAVRMASSVGYSVNKVDPLKAAKFAGSKIAKLTAIGAGVGAAVGFLSGKRKYGKKE